MTTRRDPIATVVIPARDAATVIGDQLSAIARQRDAEHFEVIVVDNASRDGTADAARRWGRALPGLEVITAADRASQGYARNAGIAAARSDAILLCDADDSVAPTWAERMLTALSSADSVIGRVAPWSERSRARPAFGNASFATRFGFLPGFGGNNAAFTKRVWADVGGFDESIHPAEDIDLSWRIQLAGYSVAFASDAVVFARPRTTSRAIFRQSYRYGRAQVALYAKHRGAGMPRTSTALGVRQLASLVRHAPDLVHGAAARRSWAERAGWRLGRVTGSVTFRTLYL